MRKGRPLLLAVGSDKQCPEFLWNDCHICDLSGNQIDNFLNPPNVIAAIAGPASHNSFTTVFLAVLVRRQVARIEFPSTRQCNILARFSVASWFIVAR